MIVNKSLEEWQDSCALVCILFPSREHQFSPHPHPEERNGLLDFGCVSVKVDEILVVLFGVSSRRLRPRLAVQPNMHGDSSSSLERLAAILARVSAGSRGRHFFSSDFRGKVSTKSDAAFVHPRRPEIVPIPPSSRPAPAYRNLKPPSLDCDAGVGPICWCRGLTST